MAVAGRRVAHLTDVVERTGEIEASFPRDDRLERLARHVLHHHEKHVVVLLGRQDRNDVGMIERRKQTRFVQEFTEVDTLPMRHLDRDLLVDPGVAGEVYGTEAPLPIAERSELTDLLAAKTFACVELYPGEQ